MNERVDTTIEDNGEFIATEEQIAMINRHLDTLIADSRGQAINFRNVKLDLPFSNLRELKELINSGTPEGNQMIQTILDGYERNGYPDDEGSPVSILSEKQALKPTPELIAEIVSFLDSLEGDSYGPLTYGPVTVNGRDEFIAFISSGTDLGNAYLSTVVESIETAKAFNSARTELIDVKAQKEAQERERATFGVRVRGIARTVRDAFVEFARMF